MQPLEAFHRDTEVLNGGFHVVHSTSRLWLLI